MFNASVYSRIQQEQLNDFAKSNKEVFNLIHKAISAAIDENKSSITINPSTVDPLSTIHYLQGKGFQVTLSDQGIEVSWTLQQRELGGKR